MEENYPLRDYGEEGYIKVDNGRGEIIDIDDLPKVELNLIDLYQNHGDNVAHGDLAAIDKEKKELFEVLPLRNVHETEISKFIEPVSDVDKIVDEQGKDKYLSKLRDFVVNNQKLNKRQERLYGKQLKFSFLDKRGILCRKIKNLEGEEISVIWWPEGLKHEILVAYHTSIFSGHPGESATIAALRKEYYWKGLATDVKKFVKSCTTCLKYKERHSKPFGFMSVSEVTAPNHTLACDVMGPLLPSGPGRFRYLFLCIDVFTRMIKIFPLRKITAKNVSKCLINLFCELGRYNRVVSDNHSIFSNSLWTPCLKLLKAQESVIARREMLRKPELNPRKNFYQCTVMTTETGLIT